MGWSFFSGSSDTTLHEDALSLGLQAEALSIGYRGHVVASQINLTLNLGEVVCLLGPNGSGKTTLLNTLLGIAPPCAGVVKLFGQALSQMTAQQRARQIAYVPQATIGAFAFRVHELVQMGRLSHRGVWSRPTRADAQAVDAALDQLKLTPLAQARYAEISGGERQLVLIARALAQGASLLLMDEPTASLDIAHQWLVLQQIRRLAKAGVGVLCSTHDPAQALALADRVALLGAGRLQALGPPRAVLTPASLHALYGVPMQVHEVAPGRFAVYSIEHLDFAQDTVS